MVFGRRSPSDEARNRHAQRKDPKGTIAGKQDPVSSQPMIVQPPPPPKEPPNNNSKARPTTITKPPQRPSWSLKSLFLGSPFGIFLTASVCLNLPPIIVGFTDIAGLVDFCLASIWLVVNSVFCLVHIVAAVYVSRSVLLWSSTTQQHHSKQQQSNNKRRMLSKVHRVFCHDPTVTFYIWFVAFYAVFCVIPIVVTVQPNAKDFVDNFDYHNYYGDDDGANNNNDDNNNDYCGPFSHEKVFLAMAFCLTWIVLGTATLLLGVCVAYEEDAYAVSTTGGVGDDEETGQYRPPVGSYGIFSDAPEDPPPRSNQTDAPGTSFFQGVLNSVLPKKSPPRSASPPGDTYEQRQQHQQQEQQRRDPKHPFHFRTSHSVHDPFQQSLQHQQQIALNRSSSESAIQVAHAAAQAAVQAAHAAEAAAKASHAAVSSRQLPIEPEQQQPKPQAARGKENSNRNRNNNKLDQNTNNQLKGANAMLPKEKEANNNTMNYSREEVVTALYSLMPGL